MLGGDQTMIDILFDASIADVLESYVSDPRLQNALYGQGIIGAYAGPRDWGTASVKLMHYQGDLLGQGPVWGYVEGGMGRISFAIAEAARDLGAVLAAGVPVAEILPGRGGAPRGRRPDPGEGRRVERRPEAGARHARARRRARRRSGPGSRRGRSARRS